MIKQTLERRLISTNAPSATKAVFQLMKDQLAKVKQIKQTSPSSKPLRFNQKTKFDSKKPVHVKSTNQKREIKEVPIMKLNYKKKETVKVKPAYVPLNNRKKSEFDNIIKDWSTTNWLNTTPIIQQKPCHILIHDKLLYENLNLFETVHNVIAKSIPEIAVSYQDLQPSLELEVSSVLLGQVEPMSNLMIERSLKKIIKNVYTPYVQSNKDACYKLNRCVKDSFLVRKIFTMLNSNVKFNDIMLSKLKTIENLNQRNDISIIKDNELTLIPSFDYRALLTRLNKRVENPIKQMTLLQYKSILGHKINDFQNLQIMKNLLISDKLHRNERFVIVTGERSTSLEYFRLLKLFNKTYSDLKLKGCVVFVDLEGAAKSKLIPIKKEKSYTGKEYYYVVEEFSEIYDIIEVL